MRLYIEFHVFPQPSSDKHCKNAKKEKTYPQIHDVCVSPVSSLTYLSQKMTSVQQQQQQQVITVMSVMTKYRERVCVQRFGNSANP